MDAGEDAARERLLLREGMVKMHENGCAGLQAYLDDADENLWFKLRMTLEWDETSFRRMVQALVDCLEATEGAELVPRTLAWIFVSAVPRILALMSRPDFTARNAGEHSPADVSAYFARRKEVLHSLSLWFTDGKALVPDERLSVGDWSPALRRTREGG